MKKLWKKWKNFYRNNKVLAMLIIIIIICFIVIFMACFQYFFMGIATNKYGDRLDPIKNVKISNSKQDSIAKKLKATEKVKNSSVNVTGRIIYVTIITEDSASIEEGEGIAVTVLDMLSEKQKNSYDIQFFLKNDSKETGFSLMGAKNINSNAISWTNNTAENA